MWLGVELVAVPKPPRSGVALGLIGGWDNGVVPDCVLGIVGGTEVESLVWCDKEGECPGVMVLPEGSCP